MAHRHIQEIYHLIADSSLSPSATFVMAIAITYTLRLRRIPIPWWIALALGVNVARLTAAGAYLLTPILFGDTESDVACISALALRGSPVYPAPHAASQYPLVYGPLTYLAAVPLYLAFGANLVSFKLLGFLACVVSTVGLYQICRKYAAPAASLLGLGCASLILFRYLGIDFYGRSDPLILCAIVLCTWIALGGPRWAAVLSAALVFAIVPNFKASGIAYLLPISGLIVIRYGWRAATGVVILGALLFTLPFCLPEVSFTNYAFILQINRHHGISLDLLLRNIQYSLLMMAPVLAMAFVRLRRGLQPSLNQLWYLALISVAMAASCIFGAKIGAGSYHLLPYVVPLLHLYFWMRSEQSAAKADQVFLRFAIPWTLTIIIFSAPRVQFVLSELQFARSGQQIVSEIRRVEKGYKGQTVEVGIGNGFYDRRTRYSYLTTFDGQPFTIGANPVRDLQFSGVELPYATVRYIESCGTEIWLIPKGQQPFSATNTYYPAYHAAFDAQFREAFYAHYEHVSSGNNFDVWSCRK